jgi:magnesium-transporting ATPase (P-type)
MDHLLPGSLGRAIGDLKDVVMIAIVLLLNASLRFFPEHRAEAALVALESMQGPTERVLRDGGESGARRVHRHGADLSQEPAVTSTR